MIERELPDEETREMLLDALALLVKRIGVEPLVTHPFVLGTRDFFPEPVPGTVGGLRSLLRRILVFAGLPELQPRLVTFEAGDELSEELARGAVRHGDVPAFFAGIEDDHAVFGFDVTRWSDPDGLLGTLAHEVAHAFRRHKGVEARDREAEERLTDLTAMYLGFGPLILNAAYVHRTSAEQDGAFSSYAVSISRTGYLPVEDVAFVLAALIRLRGMGKDRRAALLEELASAQRAMVRAALRVLPSRDELLLRLELPEPGAWGPEVAPTAEQLDLLTEQEDDDDELVAELEREPEDHDQARPGVTYRLRGLSSWGARVVGAVVGGLLGLVPTAFGAPGELVYLSAAFGVIFGPYVPLYFCADPACGARQWGIVSVCDGCGRPVEGTLSDASEWLEVGDGGGRDRPRS